MMSVTVVESERSVHPELMLDNESPLAMDYMRTFIGGYEVEYAEKVEQLKTIQPQQNLTAIFLDAFSKGPESANSWVTVALFMFFSFIASFGVTAWSGVSDGIMASTIWAILVGIHMVVLFFLAHITYGAYKTCNHYTTTKTERTVTLEDLELQKLKRIERVKTDSEFFLDEVEAHHQKQLDAIKKNIFLLEAIYKTQVTEAETHVQRRVDELRLHIEALKHVPINPDTGPASENRKQLLKDLGQEVENLTKQLDLPNPRRSELTHQLAHLSQLWDTANTHLDEFKSVRIQRRNIWNTFQAAQKALGRTALNQSFTDEARILQLISNKAEQLERELVIADNCLQLETKRAAVLVEASNRTPLPAA